ncbi:MAG: hypothetical protein OXH28_00705 [bacterium]|nr:hypothetical protein [bacterium]
MTPKQKIELRQSERRERLNELAGLDTLTDEQTTELNTLTGEYQTGERQLRAAIIAEDAETAAATAAGDGGEDPERRALRSRARLGNFLQAALTGAEVTGAELELRQAAEGSAGDIPMELFAPLERRADTASTAPTAGRGVDVEPIRPAIFARSVAGRLGIAMPQTGTGSFSTMTITTNLTAGAMAAGASRESTAAALTAKTTEAHRVTARLSIRIEDIYRIGTESFEAALRQNLTLAMSAQLDDFCLNGTGASNQPQGLIPQLTDPTDPTDVMDWAGFVSLAAGGIDGGPWAEDMTAVRLCVNADTIRLAETTFREPGTVGTPADQYSDTPGEMSAAAYLRAHSGGLFASSRMPATASNIAAAVRYRAGTTGLDGVNAGRTAVCPTWAMLAIDDIYTDAAAGTKHLTLHALVGDVLLEQSDAYERVDVKVA